MGEHDRRAGVLAEVTVSPAHQGDQSGGEVEAPGGQAVLVPDGPDVVGAAFEHAVVDQLLEPVGEDVASDAEVAMQVLEATDAAERVTQDQERPAVADDLEGAGDGAGIIRHSDGR